MATFMLVTGQSGSGKHYYNESEAERYVNENQRCDEVHAAIDTLQGGNASVLQDWAYICKRDFERLHKDGYLVEVCAGADAERAREAQAQAARTAEVNAQVTATARSHAWASWAASTCCPTSTGAN